MTREVLVLCPCLADKPAAIVELEHTARGVRLVIARRPSTTRRSRAAVLRALYSRWFAQGGI